MFSCYEDFSLLFARLIELLEKRRWTRLPDPLDFTADRLRERTPNLLQDMTDIEKLAFPCRDSLHECDVLVMPISNAKLNVKTVRHLFENCTAQHVVGLTAGTITPFARNYFENTLKVKLEHLQFNMVMVSPALLKTITIEGRGGAALSRCKQLKLPKLNAGDTITKMLSLTSGDVINIHGTSHRNTQRWV